MRLNAKLLALLLAILLSPVVSAQSRAVAIRSGATDPTTCQPSGTNIFLNTTTDTLKLCTASNTWTASGALGTPGISITETLGAEEVTDTVAAWDILGAGWSVSDTPQIELTGVLASSAAQNSTATVVAGTTYKLVFTYTRTAGTLTPSLGGDTGTAVSAAGPTTVTEYFAATATTALAFTGAGFSGTVYDVSAKAITSVIATDTGPLVLDPANDMTILKDITITGTCTGCGAGGALEPDGTNWPVTAAVAHENTLTIAPSVSDTPVAIIGIAADACKIYVGAGSPEGVITAPICSTFWRNDGGANTILYAKESGAGNTGWVAYGAAAAGATTALDNLAAVAINTSLISDTANTDALGTAAIPWALSYINGISSGTGQNLPLLATAPAATVGASQVGKSASLTASDAVASTDTAGAAAGGAVTITGGAAARNTSGNANGGDINLVGGAGVGTGTAGQVVVSNGTAAKPGLVGAADSDTGLVFAANSLSLNANGITALEVINGGMNFTGSAQFAAAVLNGGKATIRNDVADNTLNGQSENGFSIGTNAGATALVTETFPAATAGLIAQFVCMDTDGLKALAVGDDTIRVIDKVTGAAGYIQSNTLGSMAYCVAMDTAQWVCRVNGVWTDGTWTYDDTGLTSP